MTYWWEQHKVSVPPGVSGEWKIEKFSIDEEESHISRLRAMLSHSCLGRGFIPPGDYTRLVDGSGEVIMSDAPDEIIDLDPLRHAISQFGVKILLNGLGLGVALQMVLQQRGVGEITVIEKSDDVIQLVANHYMEMANANDKDLAIIRADALEWKPPKNICYDIVWHDIWSTICTDHLLEMHKLHRRYGHRCRWQGSWCRKEMEAYKRESERTPPWLL